MKFKSKEYKYKMIFVIWMKLKFIIMSCDVLDMIIRICWFW